MLIDDFTITYLIILMVLFAFIINIIIYTCSPFVSDYYEMLMDNTLNMNSTGQGGGPWNFGGPEGPYNNNGGQDPRPDNTVELDPNSRKRKRPDEYDLWDDGEGNEDLSERMKAYVEQKKLQELLGPEGKKYDPSKIILQLKRKWEPYFKKAGYTQEDIDTIPTKKEVSNNMKKKLTDLFEEKERQRKTGNIIESTTNVHHSGKFTPQEEEYLCDKVWKHYDEKAKNDPLFDFSRNRTYNKIKGRRPFREYHGPITKDLLDRLYKNWKKPNSW